MALWVARPLFPSEAAAVHGDGMTAVMLWLLLTVAWLVHAAAQPRFQLRVGWTDAAAGLLIGWHSLAALHAVRHESPRPALNMLWEWIGLGLAYFLMRQLLDTQRQARATVAVMIALAAGLSTYRPVSAQVECRPPGPPTPPTRKGRCAAGIVAPPGSPDRQYFEDRLQNNEPIATFALTNSLAAMLAPWLVLAVGVAVAKGIDRPLRRGAVPSADSPPFVCRIGPSA